MSDYPCLLEMGIDAKSIPDIYKFSLRQEGKEDILKVYFKRKSGDFMASSRKFRFGRAQHSVRVKDSPLGYEDHAEISPFLRKAVDELTSLVKQENQKALNKQRILEDLDHLERVVKNKIDDLRRDLERLG